MILNALVILIFSAVNFLSMKRNQKKVIGDGDIKFFGVLFFIYSLPVALSGLWLASLIAIPGFPILKKLESRFREEKRIPFGFFIALIFFIIEISSFSQHIDNGILTAISL